MLRFYSRLRGEGWKRKLSAAIILANHRLVVTSSFGGGWFGCTVLLLHQGRDEKMGTGNRVGGYGRDAR